jgi:hypothetical protein
VNERDELIARVKRAEAAKRRAEEEFRASLLAAVESGIGYAQLATETGMSRQRVRQLATRAGVTSPRETAMRARRDELDARWERFVDELTAAYFVDPDAKREQLKRNQENGKRKRKYARAQSAARKRGLACRTVPALVPTVRSDARRAAETYALRLLDGNADHPVLGKAVRELDEAAALREKLLALEQARVPFLRH